MSDRIIIYGLIGFPLTHSRSAEYFSSKFEKENLKNRSYRLFSLPDLKHISEFIKTPGLAGFNVTIPYKMAIISLLDEIDEEASSIGAVNTVKVIRKNNGVILKGYNTDSYGFSSSSDFSGFHRALILGTGGASRAVQYSLKKMGIPFLLVSREKKGENTITYKDLDEKIISSHKLIINTTPAGMYPDIESFPDIPYDFTGPYHFLYDLVYNPELTIFLKKGSAHGARIQNGLRMLYLQAEKSYHIWNSD